MKLKFKLSFLSILSIVALLLIACGGGDDAPQATPAPTPAPDAPDAPAVIEVDEPSEPVRDLGGLEIVIGNWWYATDTDTYEPATAHGEAMLDQRIYFENRYNFRVFERPIATWEEMAGIAATSILAGDPAATVFVLEPQWWSPLQQQGMWAPLVGPSIDFTDRTNVPWNYNYYVAASVNGVPYAFVQQDLVGGGVFWNLRLFEEAGLDAELPFDLVMAGEWTWDRFIEIANQVTRDVDNDGVIDIFGFAGIGGWTFQKAMASNNAGYVYRHVDGTFENRTNTPEFAETLNWIRSWQEQGFVMPPPEGGYEWNWWMEMFTTGQAAMTTGFDWMSFGDFAGMTDTIGFVPFPMGPRTTQHQFSTTANLLAIPIQFADRVDDIMFALELWWTEPEGFRDPYDWMNVHFTLWDHPRTVEESLLYFNRNQDLIFPPLQMFIHGLDGAGTGALFDWHVWNMDWDVGSIIESAQGQMEALVEEANN